MKYTCFLRVMTVYTVRLYYILVLLIFFCPALAFAQQKQTKDPNLAQRVDSLITIMQNSNSTEEKTEIARQVYNLSKSISYDKGLMEGKLTLISGLNGLGKQSQTLKLIDSEMYEAIHLGIPSYIIKLLTLKASCYAELGFYEESRTALSQATSYAQKLKDNNAYHYALGDIFAFMASNIEAANGNPDSALLYLKNSSQHYARLTIKPKNNINLYGILNRIGMTYFDKEQYDSAKKYLPNIYLVREDYRKNNKIEVLITYLTDARLKYITKSYQKSLIAYQSALDLSIALKASDFQKAIYKDLSQVYDKLDDQKNNVFFMEKYAKITDSLNLAGKKEMRQPLEGIIKDKNNAASAGRNLYISIIAALTILIVCSVFFYRYRKRDVRLRRISVPQEARYETPSGQKENTLNELVDLARKNSPILYDRFNELDPEFCKRLLVIAPSLLITELELCIYIRLNFDTKEIARYARSSVKAVQARKYRLRKKLDIPTKEDLTNWIINF
ncbi:helix-turn-helix transcriptional regulator [Pedobacter cryoconitis]|uniref:Tetratricopeptide (TPR) repeat protein n=1 Tax=Pedobacter cryoconitis TaxID=188932 RepID=A0A7X0J782_9SPHI|nr:tetratricopeptide repeat protein [Pedobacter cryoconitis]MBB6500951.1 tetratricopeptide (TPR) repeat protein [Pedobacter cryoconitis]